MKYAVLRGNVTVEIHDVVKYDDKREGKDIQYSDVESYEVVTGDRATEIGIETDEYSRDPCNEYLVIYFKDGTTATFRNSYVDLFLI